MPGDIKLATLSDTTVENIGVNSDELVVDDNGDWVGDFNAASDLSGWQGTNAATLSIVDNTLQIQGGGASYQTAYTTVNVVQGGMYQVSARNSSNTASMSARVRVSSASPLGGDIINGNIKTPASDHTYTFVAPHTGIVYIALLIQDVNGNSTSVWDNISVRATTELITNGDFSNGTTGWAGLSGGVLSIDDGRLKIEETTNAVDAYAVNSSVISTVVGQRYLITWQFIKGNNTGFSVRFGNSGDQTFNYKSNIVGEYTDDGYYSFEFIATGTELNLSFIVNEVNSYGFVDNISVRPAVDDRSVNNNGLQIIGEINKAPVAPGADLVAYSGFSANDYLVQPYNEDLNFGTGDFCVMGWFKQSATTDFILIFRARGRISVYVDSIYFEIKF